MHTINRRTALARIAAAPAALAAGTGAASASSPTQIETLFAEWLDVARRYAWPETQEERDRGFAEYRRLQDAIISAEPVCARDVAIMLYVDTDEGESLVSDDFRHRMYEVAGVPVPAWEAGS